MLTMENISLNWVDAAGFIAAILMFTTFYMKKMVPLRIVGMASNVTFIIYASAEGVWPLLLLHSVLLPLNLLRMWQMLHLVEQVSKVRSSDISFDFLLPYMSKETYKAGQIVFRQGDHADKLYMLYSGEAHLLELGLTLSSGNLIGEMGIFSREKVRMASLECITDVTMYSVTDFKIHELYFQNPAFGFHLIQLVIDRLQWNMVSFIEGHRKLQSMQIDLDEMLKPVADNVQFKAGNYIFRKGEPADCMYYIRSGSACVEELNKEVGQGEIFGEMGVFSDDHTRLASLKCITDVDLFALKSDKLVMLYARNPDFSFYLIQLIVTRLKSNV